MIVVVAHRERGIELRGPEQQLAHSSAKRRQELESLHGWWGMENVVVLTQGGFAPYPLLEIEPAMASPQHVERTRVFRASSRVVAEAIQGSWNRVEGWTLGEACPDLDRPPRRNLTTDQSAN
jgi:hypothetical protein